ncbi:protein of unknown function [Mesobacillus persicus]|uniref:DUF4652 domain-containing protein n=1 Tax=Mesobacillus persicus TaxID=930146 RepID=A0A1H8K692_9BACI|nr:DUF4652 domain-containing protein [Mesobacillus persicus]SEN88569.1 protein of unknown function [Mesobacillus persicus]
MKKYLMFLLLLMTLIVGACSNTEESTSETPTDTESTEKQNTLTTEKESEERVSQKDKEETNEVPDFYDIQLNTETNTIELLPPNGEPVILAESNPSEPLKSPNGEMAAYISPYGWEELSDLYLVDLQDGSQSILVTNDSESKPKEFIWQDDDHVLVIIGYPHGTVNVGGDIYRINIETNEKEEIVSTDDKVEITDLERIEDGVLYYSGIQYTDEQWNEHQDYSNQVSLKND